jgi:hypothetical protein
VVEEIEDSLEAMQAIVGGYLETIRLGPGLSLICNEDGKRLELPPNCALRTAGGGFTEMLRGDFFISRYDSAGANVSLTETDISEYQRVLDIATR